MTNIITHCWNFIRCDQNATYETNIIGLSGILDFKMREKSLPIPASLFDKRWAFKIMLII